MAASMTTSTVSNAVLVPSKEGAYSSPALCRASSLRIPCKPAARRRLRVVAMASPPPPSSKGSISDLVDESIKKATEICADGEKSGECAAAWDEVEEVSAAASDLRTKEKAADPLENFCKDNPDSDECRTYDS